MADVKAAIVSKNTLHELDEEGNVEFQIVAVSDVVCHGAEDASCKHAGCRFSAPGSVGGGTVGAFLKIKDFLCTLTCAHVLDGRLGLRYESINDDPRSKSYDGTDFCDQTEDQLPPNFGYYSHALDYATAHVAAPVDMGVLCRDQLIGSVIDFVGMDDAERKTYEGVTAMKCGQRTGITLGVFRGLDSKIVSGDVEWPPEELEPDAAKRNPVPFNFTYKNVLVIEWLSEFVPFAMQ